ncbi:hypothetical protein BLNAU_21867 [Blattamonas nauphoetae]|uniref:Uncharacterized protein n=1 Tax=Blattamonas nauphoetae TaxID=2049346 RepID=A0ABQ9WXW0_9EUKA|nr:hypothetical protein BLNAU_21867 [Blattamonas nauphoetae]
MITGTAIECLVNVMDNSSFHVRLALIEADLIAQLITSVNPKSLSFTDAAEIHTYLMAIIMNSVWFASRIGLDYLGIDDPDEERAVHETVFKQVVVPSESYICQNDSLSFPVSSIDHTLSLPTLALLAYESQFGRISHFALAIACFVLCPSFSSCGSTAKCRVSNLTLQLNTTIQTFIPQCPLSHLIPSRRLLCGLCQGRRDRIGGVLQSVSNLLTPNTCTLSPLDSSCNCDILCALSVRWMGVHSRCGWVLAEQKERSVKSRGHLHNKPLDTLSCETTDDPTKIAAALSFLNVCLSPKLTNSTVAVTVFELLSQLFKNLNPHESLLTEATLDFHRTFTSILDKILRFSSAKSIVSKERERCEEVFVDVC